VRRWPSAGVPSVRREIPVRTFADWCDPPPGFVEALAGIGTDNDSVFINETLKVYCEVNRIEFTRCRPYRKNDQAYVEQKNGADVRRLVGYRRLAGLAAARELARLYASARLFVNFFQPSFKLLEKRRDGAMVRKRYHPPATPCQRLLADERTTEEVRTTLEALQKQLDPVALLHEIRYRQRRLVMLGDKARIEEGEPEPLEKFMAALKTAWADGTPRPTEKRAAPKERWWRSRKDPFESTWPEVRQWAEAEPALTARELLQRLQAQYPDSYPDGQLRTLQRRLKIWRGEMAQELILGTSAGPHSAGQPVSP